MSNLSIEDISKLTDCFGYFYSKRAKECKKCTEMGKCKIKTPIDEAMDSRIRK